jgi:chromosome segregation ATPase
MNRFLQYFNFAGILTLAVLCSFQWRSNRNANLEVIRLEKISQQQASNLAEKEKALKGSISDLDSFRQQLAQALGKLKDLEPKLATATNENLQLLSEREALKKSLTDWVGAVSARDESLRSATLQIDKLSTDRNQAVSKFNELAEKYNSVIRNSNQLALTNRTDVQNDGR